MPRITAGAEGAEARSLTLERRSLVVAAWAGPVEGEPAAATFGSPTPAPWEEPEPAAAGAFPWSWIESLTLCVAWS